MLRSTGIFYGWLMVPAIMLMSFSSAGARFSFGAFMISMEADLGWTRAQISSVAGFNLLLAGLLRPIAGMLIDRYGSKAMVLFGLSVASVALLCTSMVSELWQFFAAYGVLLAIGYASASPVVTTTLISNWFVARRAFALSLGSTGGALGELVIVPMSAVAIALIGWQATYQAMAAFIVLLVLPVGIILIRNRPSDIGLEPLGGTSRGGGRRRADTDASMTPRQALRDVDLWRLGVGMFACGFTMSFASTHFVPFAMEMDFEMGMATWALGMVGAWAILGGITSGFLADRLGRKNVLATVYFLRGLSFIVLLNALHNPWALYGGAFLLGISWTSTTPLSSAITADRCGLTHLGTIFGTLFTVMPIGSAVGASVAGVLHDVSGGYEWSLVLSAAFGFLAALVVGGVSGSSSDRQAVIASPESQPRVREAGAARVEA